MTWQGGRCPAWRVWQSKAPSPLQVPDRTVWSGECTDRAPSGSWVGCCQQPGSRPRRGRALVRTNAAISLSSSSMCLRQRPTHGYSLDSHHRVHVCRRSTLQVSSIPKKSGILWMAHDRQKHPSIQGSNSPKHSWDITEVQSLLSASGPSRDFLPSHTTQLQAQVSITHPYPTRKEWVFLEPFQSHHIPSQCVSAMV